MNNPHRNSAPGGFNPAGFFSKEVAANPFPLFAQLRSARAVVVVPVPFGSEVQSIWMVTRHEEAVQVLKNQLFTVDPTTISRDDDQQQSPPRGPGGFLSRHTGSEHKVTQSVVRSSVFRSPHTKTNKGGV